MALVVEDGTGRTDAESYGSTGEADNYFTLRGNATWAAINATVKEQKLRLATDFMVMTFRGKFQGYKRVFNQALDFPRVGVVRDANDYVPYDIVPLEVKACCFELALLANSMDLLPSSLTQAKKRVKIGPLEVEYDNTSSEAPRFVAALRRLGPLLNASGSGFTTKLVRS